MVQFPVRGQRRVRPGDAPDGDKFNAQALEQVALLLGRQEWAGSKGLLESIRSADQSDQAGVEAQRERVAKFKELLEEEGSAEAKWIHSLADYLVKKSVWAVGGDGWAYDIGYGGLDQVMASGENINVLVLDTEVYSNTGGQMSKSTPLAAIAQFAAGGKRMPKKNLGLIVATYGNVYVAQIAFGASPAQTVKALAEAEAWDGPSIVICYAHCVAHGINMTKGIEEQKRAVACGHWPLYRYSPALEAEGKSPLVIDSKAPTISVEEYAYKENRFRSLKAKNPDLAAKLLKQLETDISRRWQYLSHLASWQPGQQE